MENSINLPIKVAAFLDGTPGHEKQTMGIVKAMQVLHPLEVTEVKIDRTSFHQNVLALLRYIFGMELPSVQAQKQYDVLIGTGSHTHVPILSCKRRCGGLSITCMAPSRLLRARFDLCFVPWHDGIQAGDNIFLTVGPPNCSEARAQHDPNKALILIGGVDPKSHHWNSAEIDTFLRDLITLDHKKEWTISSSPRTPEETVALVENLAAEQDNVAFFRYENTASGWVEEQYGRNKTVWVTADSMSMVYEALSAGCQVGILPVAWKRKYNKFKRSETNLLEQGLVISFHAWREGTAQWKLHQPLNEAGRCAEEILRRWFPKN